MEIQYRLVAIDETRYCLLDDKFKGCKVYVTYAIMEGEATYVCSLTPSQWYEVIGCTVIAPEDSGIDEEELHNLESDILYASESAYMEFNSHNKHPHSDVKTIEVDDDDLEGLSEDQIHRMVWDAVVEDSRSNPPYIPGL